MSPWGGSKKYGGFFHNFAIIPCTTSVRKLVESVEVFGYAFTTLQEGPLQNS